VDDQVTLADLRRRVAEFIAARDWEQLHTPKNLSASIAKAGKDRPDAELFTDLRFSLRSLRALR
jgi:hypothetical protein